MHRSWWTLVNLSQLRMLKNIQCLKNIAVIFVSANVFAATEPKIVVSQKNETFSIQELTVKVGEAVRFSNDEPKAKTGKPIIHSVYSNTKGNEFEFSDQKPGTFDDVTFKEPGEVKVLWAIHPKMKLK